MSNHQTEQFNETIGDLRTLIGDFEQMINIIGVIDNGSRDKIINILGEKVIEYRNELAAIMDLVKYKKKS